jgi:O-antigen/teichoic acid export membrane protein
LLASAFSFGLSLFLTPLISRLYGPAEYGVFAFVNGIATIMATLALVSLPNALAVSHSSLARLRLTLTTLKLSSLGVAATFLFIAALQSGVIVEVPWMGPWVILACPALVLAVCLSRIASSLTISLGLFRGQVRGRFAYALLTRPVSVIFGTLFPAKSWIMVAAEVAGFLGQALMMKRDLTKPLGRIGRRPWAKVRAWDEISRHRNFSAFDYPTQLLVIGVSTIPALIIAYRFGPETAGLVTLALSLLTIPIQLLALAIAPALLFRIRQWATRGDIQARRTLGLAFVTLATMAMVGYGILAIVAPWLMPAYLGQKWIVTGHFVVWFSLAFAIQFLATPFEATYWFSGHTRAKLFISLAGFMLSIIALLLPPAHAPMLAIRHWAFILVAQRLAELILLIFASWTVQSRAK